MYRMESLISFIKLPHLHLVVTRRHARPRGLDDIVNWLSGLPSIIQHHSTVEWRFLETPADGEVLLVCQSSQLGTHFASDGYVWASVEETMRKEVNGHVSPVAQRLLTNAELLRRYWRYTASKAVLFLSANQ